MRSRMSMRDWIIFAERYGIPYVTGTYGRDTSDEDTERFGSALEAALG